MLHGMMPVWVFLILIIQVIYLIRIVTDKMLRDVTGADYIAIVLVTIGYSVPAIYEFGWVVLPSFGIGAIR